MHKMLSFNGQCIIVKRSIPIHILSKIVINRAICMQDLGGKFRHTLVVRQVIDEYVEQLGSTALMKVF